VYQIKKLEGIMKSQNIQKQKGFTLVEIAIVLVIIGLLLGGVLKGQELITSAKVKSDTAALVALQSSAYAYSDRMGYYPGTARAAVPADATKDKVQIVDKSTTAAGTLALPADLGNFFADLADQGFLKDANMSPEIDAIGTFSAGYGEDGTTGGVAATAATVKANKNYVCISYDAATDNAESILRGMDIKMDDGVAITGTLRTSPDTACLEL
jgi:prepilin-type N-terminal cleavage/methylation domain-containing protein